MESAARQAGDRIVCDLLTGFLGSGKTTLLNRLLRTGQARGAAVVVNEVGKVGIDQLILTQVSENVALLESGCLCCTLNGSLRETLLDLKRQARQAGRPLTRVLVETTGLAEPAPILHALLGDKTLTDSFVLGRIIATVDAQQALVQIKRQRETVHQIALADVLAITKTDLAGPESADALSAALDTLNRTARRVDAREPDALARIFETPLATEHARRVSADEIAASGHHHTHGNANSTSLWLDASPINLAGWAAWTHLLVQEYGDRLLRCKGLLHLSAPVGDAFVQGVGRYFYAPEPTLRWPDADPRSRLVVIGERLDPAWLQDSLRALRIDEPGLLPRTMAELNQVVDSTPIVASLH